MTATEITPEAAQLLEYLNTLDRWTTWEEMSRRGVELVDTQGVFSEVLFHLATGEMMYPTDDGWDVLVNPTSGVQVQSGNMTRYHSSGISPQARIHPTAIVDPTARVEGGARPAGGDQSLRPRRPRRARGDRGVRGLGCVRGSAVHGALRLHHWRRRRHRHR